MAIVNASDHGFTNEKGIYKLDKIIQDIEDLKKNNSSTATILNAIYPVGAIYLGIKADDNPGIWGKKNGLNMNWTWTPFGGESKFLLLTSPTDPGHVGVGKGYNGNESVVKNETTDKIRYKKTFNLSTANIPAHTHSIPKLTGTGVIKVSAPSSIKYNNNKDTAGATDGDGRIYLDTTATKGHTGTKAYFIWHPNVKQFSDSSLNLEDGALHLVGGLPNNVSLANPYQAAVTIPAGERTGNIGSGSGVTLDITPPYYTVYMWRRTK